MKSKTLALRVTLNSGVMIIAIYALIQTFVYFRDNILFGTGDLSQLVPLVFGFLASRVFGPIFLFGILLYSIAYQIQKVQQRLEAGEVLSPEVVEKTRRRILGFGNLVMALNLVGFAIGYVLDLVVTGHIADILLPHKLIVLISNLAGGFVFATAQSALNNLAFADLRERLNIHAIGERKREMRSTLRQVLLTSLLLIYVATVMQYNMRDVMIFTDLQTPVVAKLNKGELSPGAAATEYRQTLKATLPVFTNRVTLDVETVKVPWERPESAADIQQGVFWLLFLLFFLMGMFIQAVCSLELRSQLRAIQNRIREVTAGGGDLRGRLSLRTMDDNGEMTELINQLLDQFHTVVIRIGNAAGQTKDVATTIDRVLAESERVLDATGRDVAALKTDLEAQATESKNLVTVLETFRQAVAGVETASRDQRQFVTATSTAMDAMATSIQSVETMTERAGAITAGLAAQGAEGGQAVTETATAIQEIEAASRQVLEVLGALNKISASTNLLAMNAAIEAAHAGQHGTGFAVVADEVRKLANTAATQTKAIRDLIQSMMAKVNRGVERSVASGQALQKLVAGLQEAASISQEISGAMKHQAGGTQSVADSLTHVVDSAEQILHRTGEQAVQTDRMATSLGQALERLLVLSDSSKRQTESVVALQRSFGAVRGEVDKNLAAVGALTAEIERFQV